ncbi:CccA Cytochrome c, mono- and diheme variants [Acidimicrobiia bacterium]
MRSPRVLLAGVVLVLGATAFAACSSGSTPIATPSDPVLAEGQSIYNQNCASCHGSSGGGGYGKKLAGVVATKYPNIADQEAILVNGKGSMPSFASKLTGEQITAVTRYTREVLGAEQ